MSEKKSKRVKIGSVLKSKDPTKSNYLKVSTSISLKEGEYISVESKKFQLESLERAVESGRLSGELVEKLRANIEKIPDFVLADLFITR